MPDSSDPPAPDPEAHDAPSTRSELSVDEYHVAADHFMERLLARLEERQDERGDLEAEYSVRQDPFSPGNPCAERRERKEREG
jgi:frataxin